MKGYHGKLWKIKTELSNHDKCWPDDKLSSYKYIDFSCKNDLKHFQVPVAKITNMISQVIKCVGVGERKEEGEVERMQDKKEENGRVGQQTRKIFSYSPLIVFQSFILFRSPFLIPASTPPLPSDALSMCRG